MSSSVLRPVLTAATGLRGRLIATVVVVAVLGATAVAWTGVQRSAGSLVDAVTHSHTQEVTARLTQAAPSTEYPPGPEALDRLRLAVGDDVLVTYGEESSASGVLATDAETLVTDLRPAGRTDGGDPSPGRVRTQRVELDGRIWLVVATPVMTPHPMAAGPTQGSRCMPPTTSRRSSSRSTVWSAML